VQAAPEVVSSGNFANTIAMAVDTRGRIYLSDLKRVSEARYFPVIASLSMLSAVQGTSGMAVLEGSALHTARSVEFSGRGVSATMVGKPEGTRTPIRIDVSADAEPGPHSLTVTTDTGASPPFYSLEITRPGDPPRITDLQPFSGVQGATLKGVIRGHRLDNATAVAFSGTGVTVKLDGNGSTGILPVTITVAANAVPGARALTVTTPSGTSQPFRGFAVVAPIVAAVTPATAPRGMSTLLEIMGHGVEDVVSAEVSGQGITARILSSGSPAPPEVSNWQRGGENSGRGAAKVAPTPYPVIRVVITVASRAELGARTLSLSTRNGVSPAYGGLTVVPGEGTIRTLAASVPPILSGLETPRDIGADDAGNLYIASGSAIRKITPDGKAQTIFQLPTTPGGGRPDGSLNSIVVDRAGTLYAVTGDRLRIYKITSNGVTLLAGRAGPNETEENPERNRAILNANLGAPSGIAVDQSGNLFILDTRQRNVRRIALDGALTTVAGAGAVGTAARGDATEPKPVAITVDKGNLFIAEPGRIYRIAPDGTMQKVFDDQKDLEPQRLKITALAVDPKGNLFFASENRIFRLLPNGTLRVIAGQDQSSETNDGDGGPASAATIRTTKGLAIDGKGNIYFTTPNSVRMIVGGAEL
jgi:streptogramin lyase